MFLNVGLTQRETSGQPVAQRRGEMTVLQEEPVGGGGESRRPLG